MNFNGGQIDFLIAEHLRQEGFNNTLQTFVEECRLRGREITSNGESNGDIHYHEQQTSSAGGKLDRKLSLQSDLLVSFECGERDAFFTLWSQAIPHALRESDPSCLSLEFSLAVYFTLYPFRYDIGDTQSALKYFQTYLNSKGDLLAQSPDLTIYCALPYIPDPASHSSFQHLFTESWNTELRSKLEQFLDTSLVGGATQTPHPPTLYDLYKAYSGNTDVLILRERLEELQTSYHTVAGIAIELVESLEMTISGKPLSANYIEDMCTRLFQVSSSQSLPPIRPITSNRPITNNLRASVMSLRQSIQTPVVDKYTSLDYNKLTRDIEVLPPVSKCALMQALRWRLSHSVQGPQRDALLKEYINNDLLQLNKDNLQFTTSLLSSTDDRVQESLCRLLNSLSSLRVGRDYLQSNQSFVHSLSLQLVTVKEESPVLRNLLGTVQKLSLRRPLQLQMIGVGLIQWILSLLSDAHKMSDYVLRYSLALLMNLCLRTEGKQECVLLLPTPLNVLNELLEHDSTEVRSYINGILYSLLEVNEIRQAAIDMDMIDILNSAMRVSPPELQSQLQFILNRIRAVNGDSSRPLNEEESEEDEEDDPDVIDGNEEESEHDSIVPNGEDILRNYYIIKQQTFLTSQIAPLSRPVTPLTHYHHSPVRPNTATIREQSPPQIGQRPSTGN